MILHPMSGAGRIKGDASTADGAYVEIKDANKSYTLTGDDLKKAWTEAVRAEHSGCLFIITFANGMRLTGVVERSI